MMRAFAIAMLVAACGSPSSAPSTPRGDSAAASRVVAASDVLRELDDSTDGVFPVAVAHAARCVAVVPQLIHAGLVIGARAGRGVVTCRTNDGWSDPRFFTLSGATAGVQAGVESVDLVMLAMTDASEQAFLAMKLQLGASTSFAAGPIGRSVEATSNVTLAPVLYYSRAKGLFVGLDLAGLTVDADEESTRAFYGDARDFGVLLHGTRAVPEEAARFRAEVARIFSR
jgi:lipid-binding SYLF domain-containing protein